MFVVIYKYLICAVNKTINTSHTTSTDCNTNLQYYYNAKLQTYNTIIDVIFYFLVQAFENRRI